jgi:hypothetical protein
MFIVSIHHYLKLPFKATFESRIATGYVTIFKKRKTVFSCRGVAIGSISSVIVVCFNSEVALPAFRFKAYSLGITCNYEPTGKTYHHSYHQAVLTASYYSPIFIVVRAKKNITQASIDQ